MYICESCKKLVPPNNPQIRRVVKTRKKIYPSGRVGSEIVREVKICPKCDEK